MSLIVGGPDYDPATWSLGYQDRQFGVASDPAIPGTGGVDLATVSTVDIASSIYSALTNPPANLTTAIEKPLPPE